MYQNTTQVYDHNRQCPISIWQNFWAISLWTFFFQNFRRHKHSTDVGIRNWRKNSKKESKKYSLPLFAFGFSSFLYSVIKFIKLNLVKFHGKRTGCRQAMIKISSKGWKSLRLHFFFHQIDFSNMYLTICALKSNFRKFKL